MTPDHEDRQAQDEVEGRVFTGCGERVPLSADEKARRTPSKPWLLMDAIQEPLERRDTPKNEGAA